MVANVLRYIYNIIEMTVARTAIVPCLLLVFSLPDPSSTHMGETQEERITQFLEEDNEAVVGLREGSLLRVQDGAVTLKGPNTARIFRGGEEPVEVAAGSNLCKFLQAPAGVAGTHI